VAFLESTVRTSAPAGDRTEDELAEDCAVDGLLVTASLAAPA
jgi:hypothetical protein